MARRATPATSEEIPVPDTIPGIGTPETTDRLIGHGEAEATLIDAYASGRMHHAWLITGPKGIGKATLAFRLARFLAVHHGRDRTALADKRDLSVPPDHPAARRIAAGGHGNVLHLRRPWMVKEKRFKTDLPVDEIRRTVSFFGTTAAEPGWRIAIVDAADEMNANAANALLKILEEPPRNALFLVLAHRPGGLLPTIRSRCRTLALSPLSHADLRAGLAALGLADGRSEPDISTAVCAADGSLRRALLLLSSGGVDLIRDIEAAVDALPDGDTGARYRLATRIAAARDDDAFDTFWETARRVAHARARQAASLAGASAWERAFRALRETEALTSILNLDRKAAVLSAFRALADAARDSLIEGRA